MPDRDAPLFTIRMAARIVGIHQQTLRAYEREGLIRPARSDGGHRLFSDADIERVRTIRRLVTELGVNLAGADIILRQRDEIARLKAENQTLQAALQRSRDQRLPALRGPFPRA